MIEHQRKRILRLTRENKNNRKRRRQDHNKLINFITSFASSTENPDFISISETSECINGCYGNDDKFAEKNNSFYKNDYKITELVAEKVELCNVMCSTFTRILNLTNSKKDL